MGSKPQLKGSLWRVYTTNPRKPNSAHRKVAKVQIKKNFFILSAIKGVKSNAKKFSKAWVSGYGFRDTPGVNTKLIFGKEGFNLEGTKLKRRSIYGLKRKNLVFI